MLQARQTSQADRGKRKRIMKNVKAEFHEAGMGIGKVYIGDINITNNLCKRDGRHVAEAYNALVNGDESRRPKVEARVYKKFIPQSQQQ
jgi:hypothetical protein